MATRAADVLAFRFDELTDKQHFAKDAALDALIRSRFGSMFEADARCELFAWRATTEGRQAKITVLDQFSRNLFCDTPRAAASSAEEIAFLTEPGSSF